MTYELFSELEGGWHAFCCMSSERNEMLTNQNPPLRRNTMKSLTIKDLARTEELDGKAMAAVRGGWSMHSPPASRT